jgi:hypothetical protein
MSREELADWWRLYVRALAGLLDAASAPDAPPPADVVTQIQTLQGEALFLHIRCAPPPRPPRLDAAQRCCSASSDVCMTEPGERDISPS